MGSKTKFAEYRGRVRDTAEWGGHLELLNNVSVSLAEGRNLDVVTEAEAVRSLAAP